MQKNENRLCPLPYEEVLGDIIETVWTEQCISKNTKGGFVAGRSATIMDNVIGHHACAMTMTCECRLLADRC